MTWRKRILFLVLPCLAYAVLLREQHRFTHNHLAAVLGSFLFLAWLLVVANLRPASPTTK